ncbi:PAS domain-containing protein [Luteimonas aestuarii]|nr:PAS domain-containing protein [Luteimonas aestuarii]
MLDAGAVTQAIGRIYETMLDDRAESAWLDAVRDCVGAEHAVLSDTTGPTLAMHISRVDDGMLPLAQRLSATTMYDPALASMPVRAARRMSDFSPIRELMRTDLYEDLLRPLHGGHALAFTWRTGAGRAAIAICRDATRNHDYGDDEVAAMQPLLQHLHNAFQLRMTFLAQQAVMHRAHAALDAIQDGVAIVGVDGRVRYVNPAARAMLLDGGALQLDRGALRAARSEDEHRLFALVRSTVALRAGMSSAFAQHADDSATGGGIPIALRRDPPRRPLLATVAPAVSTMGLHGVPAFADAAMLVLRDPDQKRAPAIGVLLEMFRLTRREAQLALALQAGEALSVAAARLGITEGTARQYLKSVFAKTGVERQSELAVLLRNLA